MLERLFLKQLTKKGKKIYFIGLLGVLALVVLYIFAIAGYTMRTGKNPFFVSFLLLNVIWMAICYFLFKKEDNDQEIKE